MIRKATAEDMEWIHAMYMHPAVNPFLLYEQKTLAEFQPIYEDLLNRGIKYIFFDHTGPVGMFKLIPLQHRNSHIAYLGGLAIHPDHGGGGNGGKMLGDIIAFAQQAGFHRIELSVASFNYKAIRLYEKHGFQKEGVMKNFTYLNSEGKFIDEVLMAWLAKSD